MTTPEPGLIRQVALVTGGARGIGIAVAQALSQAGAIVVIGDVDIDAARHAAGKIGATAGFVDVTSPDSFSTLLGEIEQRHGRLDILINNAGIMPVGPFLGMKPDVMAAAVSINLLGVANGCRVIGEHMAARGSGRIVNIASVAGRLPVPGMAVYNGTKFGVLGLTEALCAELAPQGVRVSVVLPTFTRTALIAGLNISRLIQTVEPADVARAVLKNLAGAYSTPVPGSQRVSLALLPVLPRRVRAALTRASGLNRAFLTPDPIARADYDARIAHGPQHRPRLND